MERSRTRITVVSHIFAPDELGGAALMTDLANYLLENGFDVNVVSTFPYYPRWCLREEDKRCWRRVDRVGSLEVTRVRMYIPASPSALKRMLSDLSYFLSVLVMGRRAWSRADLILTTCPLLGQTLAMRFARPFSSIPKMLILQDFVLDAAIELGMIRGHILCSFLRKLERFALRSCGTVSTISEEMHSKLDQLVGSGRRTLVIPNWVHRSLADLVAAKRAVAQPRRKAELFYSGNVGKKQGLGEYLSWVAGIPAPWRVKIHGGGAEFAGMATRFEGVPNIEFRGLQTEDKYVESLLSCTACIITQKAGVGANFLPSKLLPSLVAGTPVLAICDRLSPLGREVLTARCGVVIEPGQINELPAIVKRWFENPAELEVFSANAIKHSEKYSRDIVLGRYRSEILAMLGRE